MTSREKQEKLAALNEASRCVSDVRVRLCEAGLMDYDADGNDAIYTASVALSDLIYDLTDSVNAEVEWSVYCKEAWRTNGTVIVARTDFENGTEYALDPDFKIKGNHYVWLDGYRLFESSTGGSWCRVGGTPTTWN